MIRQLEPDDALLYVDFIAGPHFGHAPDWSGCYCRFYQAEVSHQAWLARTSEDNRKEAIAEIEAGRMKGYLVFDGELCVGWCNANDTTAFYRVREEFLPYTAEGNFGATMCFVIHADYRGQGLARRMLKQIVNDYKTMGYAGMLALPFESKENPEKRYRGTKKMYEELGYQQVAEDDGVFIMKLVF